VPYSKKRNQSVLKKNDEKFVGSYETMKDIYHKIGIASNNDLSVLIYGKTGTGKELIAKLIHESSNKKDFPIVSVNCASIPKDLFESQLFGHEKGSFTGADKQYIGLTEQAEEGTLFLDEIGELDAELQSKLLRFLESRSFRRVGGTKDIKFKGRVLSATNADLKKNIENGLFREDLYFRISMLMITLPSLNERIRDLPTLCDHFIAKANKDLKTSVSSISQEALAKLEKHQWKGNIRELRNTLYSACLNAQNNEIGLEQIVSLNKEVKDIHSDIEKLCLDYLNKEGIEKAKDLNQILTKIFLQSSFHICPNISQLSLALNISRNTLKKQLKEFDIYENK